GALSVVQPLLTVGLVVALPMQALLGLPVRKRALLAAALTVGGLAAFLVVQPTVESRDPQSITEWLPGLILVTLVACASDSRAQQAGPGAVTGLGCRRGFGIRAIRRAGQNVGRDSRCWWAPRAGYQLGAVDGVERRPGGCPVEPGRLPVRSTGRPAGGDDGGRP